MNYKTWDDVKSQYDPTISWLDHLSLAIFFTLGAELIRNGEYIHLIEAEPIVKLGIIKRLQRILWAADYISFLRRKELEGNNGR